MFTFELRFGSGYRFEIGAACAAYGFETASDVDSIVELFRFKEPVVGRVEIFALDVETGERQTLPGGFFNLFLRGADLAQAFAKFDGAGVQFEGGAETFDGAVRGLVLHKELGIEEGGLYFADMLGL